MCTHSPKNPGKNNLMNWLIIHITYREYNSYLKVLQLLRKLHDRLVVMTLYLSMKHQNILDIPQLLSKPHNRLLTSMFNCRKFLMNFKALPSNIWTRKESLYFADMLLHDVCQGKFEVWSHDAPLLRKEWAEQQEVPRGIESGHQL